MRITECRICKSCELTDVVDLGIQGLASVFPRNVDNAVPAAPLVLCMCHKCGLVQLRHSIPQHEMYETMSYGYRSGLNATMRQHLEHIVKEAIATFKDISGRELTAADTVLDIGSNDSTLLRVYEPHVMRVGIDPTGAQFREFYPDDVELIPDYFSAKAFGQGRKAKIVTSIAMFYDLPDPQAFMNDVAAILDHDGIWVMEQSYLPTMLERQSFDTICHEHLEYYGLSQIVYMAERAGLHVIKVSFNDCNGGSFRVTLSHMLHSQDDIVTGILKAEAYLLDPSTYTAFMKRCENSKRQLQDFLTAILKQGKTICLYGASTKGNVLLQYYGITHQHITAAAERNPDKYGAYTPVTYIPIVSEAEVRALKPDYMLVLPWHFKDEFLSREQAYLNDGGQFIFPLPQVRVVSTQPTALITGITGQIGHYMTELLLSKGYHVYGTSRNSNIDMYGTVVWSNVSDALSILQPREVYHLAACTDSHLSITEPVETMNANATFVAELCNALPTGSRMFVANSVELFKGTQVPEITETDMETHFHPRTPYGIAKLAAYWIVKNARDLQGKFICSGILTNTESPLRHPSYVTSKIVTFVATLESSRLTLGNLNTHRDWIHAHDVAMAAWLMLQQEHPQDYFVATSQPHTITDFINGVLDVAGVTHHWVTDTRCVLTNSGACIEGNQCKRSYEVNDGTTIYSNARLCSIGWKPQYSLIDLVKDMYAVKTLTR